MSTPPFPKLKVPPKPQPPQKKKKKNAPDRPQPSWLFPPDEENPVLNPQAKNADEIIKERQERAKSLDYMRRRVHAAPDRPAPPPQLLTLIGIFLTDFGFNSTSRIFTNERKARQTLNGWEDAIGKKVEKGTPTLEKIYRDWYRDWKVGQKDETSSSGSDSESSSDEEINVKVEARGSSDDDSEASSDGFGGSDVDTKQAPKAKVRRVAQKETQNIRESSSSESSTSDSDADDEQETVTKIKKTTSAPKVATTTTAKPTVTGMINNLKRKAPAILSESDSSHKETMALAKKIKTSPGSSGEIISISAPQEEDSSDSSSSSESEDEAKFTKPKATAKPANAPKTVTSALGETSSDSNDTSDSDSSSSEVERGPEGAQVNGVALPQLAKASSDSSATVNGDMKKEYSSEISSSAGSTSSSDSDAVPPVQKNVSEVQSPAKKMHQGAKPTPLAELSAKATNDSHISNRYQPYDYAERAYQDLSVTRGKGFTKEKNKKKRGSYRGGAIDTSGGKGYKFED